MLDWLNDVHGKKTKYDYEQAILSGFHLTDFIGKKSHPDFYKLFCSELCCKALQIGGAIPKGINPSKTNPAELLKIKVFKKGKLIKS
jgi:hypothetical protein